jgi:hypothetical protein
MTRLNDMTGQRFGRWTVVSYSALRKWLCRCDCGTERYVTGTTLRDGRSKSCGCERINWKRADLIGQRFGKLVVVARGPNSKGASGNRSIFLCRCDCGNSKHILGASMVYGATRSCGCLSAVRKHGEASPGKETPEYRSWTAMMKRCNNRNDDGWVDYGGRGIKVCRRWREYSNFLADMGRKPTPQHTIDRKDVNGDYKPSNCRWATKSEQVRNRRPILVRRIEHFTTEQLEAELARRAAGGAMRKPRHRR